MNVVKPCTIHKRSKHVYVHIAGSAYMSSLD